MRTSSPPYPASAPAGWSQSRWAPTAPGCCGTARRSPSAAHPWYPSSTARRPGTRSRPRCSSRCSSSGPTPRRCGSPSRRAPWPCGATALSRPCPGAARSRRCSRPCRSAAAGQRHLVVAHLLDVMDERSDRAQERPELGARAEAAHVPLLRIPLDPHDMLGGVFAAPRDLVAEAVLRGIERRRRLPIALLERLGASLGDRVADVLDDHLRLLVRAQDCAAGGAGQTAWSPKCTERLVHMQGCAS